MALSVRAAISELLEADSELTDLASGVFHQVAPPGTNRPYVVFLKSGGSPSWTMKGPPVKRALWTVKAVGLDSEVLEQIEERLEEVLTDAELDLVGLNTMWLRRESDVSYPETVEGTVLRHLGGIYRLVTSKS